MGQAAYQKKVQVSSDNSTWFDLPSKSPSMEIGGDILDDTDLATNAGYRSRCYGLNDFSVSLDGNAKVLSGTAATDNANGATAVNMVRQARMNRTDLYVRYLPTGNVDETGLTGKVVVENFGSSGEVGGLEEFSASLLGNGPLSAAA